MRITMRALVAAVVVGSFAVLAVGCGGGGAGGNGGGLQSDTFRSQTRRRGPVSD